MPTDVHFIGVEKSVRLEEDFDKVNSQLHASDAVFTLGDDRRRLTIYQSAVAYIEEAGEVHAAVV